MEEWSYLLTTTNFDDKLHVFVQLFHEIIKNENFLEIFFDNVKNILGLWKSLIQ